MQALGTVWSALEWDLLTLVADGYRTSTREVSQPVRDKIRGIRDVNVRVTGCYVAKVPTFPLRRFFTERGSEPINLLEVASQTGLKPASLVNYIDRLSKLC